MRHPGIIFLLLWHCSLYAQLNGEYTFRHIDQTDGLLHTNIRGISQDQRGFIWILSHGGLQRFDGARFLNYPDITHQSSFGVMHGTELYIDTVSGSVCIFKGRFVQKLDLTDNTLSTVPMQSYLEDNPLFPIEGFKDANHEDWRISEAGVIRTVGQNTFSQNNHHPGQSFRNNFTLKDPETGNFWTHGYNQLVFAEPGSGLIRSSADPQPDEPLLKQIKERFGTRLRFRYLLLDSERNLWISTWQEELLRYNLHKRSLTMYSLKDIKSRQGGFAQEKLNLLVSNIYEDRQLNLWFGTEYAGLLRYNRTRDDFEWITADETSRNGLVYTFNINTIFQDRDNNIWVGTDRGISIFNPRRNHIQTIRHIEGQASSLSRHDINDVIQTSMGEILVATWGGGITCFDKDWNFLRQLNFNGPDAFNLIWRFIERDDGKIWAGTQYGYIHEYDPVKHTIRTIHPAETQNSTIRSMAKDRHGNILMGLNNGHIVTWDQLENRFIPSTSVLPQPVTELTYLKTSSDRTCWGASENGLVEFDMVTHRLTNIYQPDSTNAITGITMEGIEQYNDSLLLIGTTYRGLYLFNINTKKFSRPPGIDLSNHSSVWAIKKEGQYCWFTTDYNLRQWNMATGQIAVFNLEQSMMHTAFSSPQFRILADGRWVTHTFAEVVCFDPQSLEKDASENFSVEINRMHVLDYPVYVDSFLQQKKPVILPYDKNFFTIEFSTLVFSDRRQVNYFHRLTGVDKSWIQSTTQLYADYTDLKPGHYTFEVKATDGMRVSAVTSFPIIINPPWWGTWWFRMLCLLALIGSVYWLVKKRIKLIRYQSGLRHRVAEMEMKALRAQMNPHFIFNCLTSIDNLIQTDQKVKATDYLAKFALLIRAILENSKANSIPCWKDLDALKLYIELESLRWENQIISQVDIEPKILEGDYKVPPLVIQPFVENAIHHGLLNKLNGVKKLDIDVRMEGQSIKYTITDNGVGRTQAAVYKKLNKLPQASYGMQMSNERIDLFNQHGNGSIRITDLFDDESKPSGTKVEVWLSTQPGME